MCFWPWSLESLDFKRLIWWATCRRWPYRNKNGHFTSGSFFPMLLSKIPHSWLNNVLHCAVGNEIVLHNVRAYLCHVPQKSRLVWHGSCSWSPTPAPPCSKGLESGRSTGSWKTHTYVFRILSIWFHIHVIYTYKHTNIVQTLSHLSLYIPRTNIYAYTHTDTYMHTHLMALKKNSYKHFSTASIQNIAISSGMNQLNLSIITSI